MTLPISSSYRVAASGELRIVCCAMMLCIALANCSSESSPADRLASRIETAAKTLLRESRKEILVEFSEPTMSSEPTVIAILPDKDVGMDDPVALHLSSEQRELLHQIHRRRRSGRTSTIVLSGTEWSSIDYLSDVVDVESSFLAEIPPGDSAVIKLETGTRRARVAGISLSHR